MENQTLQIAPIEVNEEQYNKVNGSVQLLLNPKEYATRALNVLKEQLQNTISDKKRQKLCLRIERWEKALNMMMENDNVESERKENSTTE